MPQETTMGSLISCLETRGFKSADSFKSVGAVTLLYLPLDYLGAPRCLRSSSCFVWASIYAEKSEGLAVSRVHYECVGVLDGYKVRVDVGALSWTVTCDEGEWQKFLVGVAEVWMSFARSIDRATYGEGVVGD